MGSYKHIARDVATSSGSMRLYRMIIAWSILVYFKLMFAPVVLLPLIPLKYVDDDYELLSRLNPLPPNAKPNENALDDV